MSDLEREPAGAVSHLDEHRLSSLIDGEAPAADVEHAARCPACHARLDAWQQMHAIVAAPPPAPPAEQREAAIAAAMAVVPLPAAEPTPLDERRHRWVGHLIGARAAAIAAVVVLAAGVGVAAADLAGRSGTNHSSVASRAGSVNGIAPSVPAPVSASPVLGLSLGSVSSPRQLVAAIGGQLAPGGLSAKAPPAATASPVEPAAEPSPTCQSTASHLGAAGSVQPVLIAGVTYGGTPATVFVFPMGSRHVAVVTGDAGCRMLARVRF